MNPQDVATEPEMVVCQNCQKFFDASEEDEYFCEECEENLTQLQKDNILWWIANGGE